MLKLSISNRYNGIDLTYIALAEPDEDARCVDVEELDAVDVR